MKRIVRKCCCCKNIINISTDKDFFYDGKSFYHIVCFKSNKSNLKRNAWTTEKIESFIESNTLLHKKEIEQIIADKQLAKNTASVMDTQRSERLRFTDWLMFQYNITFIPKYFFIKLDSVYKGTYNGLSHPCPVEDLFDMWKQKISTLNGIAEKNRQKGKDISGVQRLSYDLSIVLSKYDSYLKWKEKQQIELQCKSQFHSSEIDYSKIDSQLHKKQKSDDIDSILDEI